MRLRSRRRGGLDALALSAMTALAVSCTGSNSHTAPATNAAAIRGHVAIVVGGPNVPEGPAKPGILIVSSVDGSNRRRVVLPRGVDAVAEPAFSPDGQRLAFIAGELRSNNVVDSKRLYVADVKTGRARQLPVPSGLLGLDPVTWSSDGKMLAFTSVNPRSGCGAQTEQDLRLYVTGAAGAGLRRLRALPREVTPGPNDAVSIDNVVWSPVAPELAYVVMHNSDPLGECGGLSQDPAELVYLPDLHGAPERLVQLEGFSTEVAWSPDGRQLAYFMSGDLDLSLVDVGSRRTSSIARRFPGVPIRWTPQGIVATTPIYAADPAWKLVLVNPHSGASTPFGPRLGDYVEMAGTSRDGERVALSTTNLTSATLALRVVSRTGRLLLARRIQLPAGYRSGSAAVVVVDLR